MAVSVRVDVATEMTAVPRASPVTAPFETEATFGSELVQARAASSIAIPLASRTVALMRWVSPILMISVRG